MELTSGPTTGEEKNMKQINSPSGQRERRFIRAWMLEQGITGVAVAEQVGVSNALVSATIGGRRNNRKILSFLADKGCPRTLLALPDNWDAGGEHQRRGRGRRVTGVNPT